MQAKGVKRGTLIHYASCRVHKTDGLVGYSAPAPRSSHSADHRRHSSPVTALDGTHRRVEPAELLAGDVDEVEQRRLDGHHQRRHLQPDLHHLRLGGQAAVGSADGQNSRLRHMFVKYVVLTEVAFHQK